MEREWEQLFFSRAREAARSDLSEKKQRIGGKWPLSRT